MRNVLIGLWMVAALLLGLASGIGIVGGFLSLWVIGVVATIGLMVPNVELINDYWLAATIVALFTGCLLLLPAIPVVGTACEWLGDERPRKWRKRP